MPFETTDIAAKVDPKPIDALKTLSGFADLNNAQNQNKFFQAKQLAGQYLAQSTGPEGQIDQGKLSQFLRADPRTGPYTAETLFSGEQIQGQGLQNIGEDLQNIRRGKENVSKELENQKIQLELQQFKYGNAQRLAAIGGTSSTNPDQSAAKIENLKNAASSIASGVAAGLISPEIATTAYANLADFTNAAIVSGAGGPATTKIGLGEQGQVNLGGSVQTVTQRPQLGQAGTVTSAKGSAANLPTTLTPGGEAAPISGVSPNGQPFTVPTSVTATPTGQPRTNVAGITGPHGEVNTDLAPGVRPGLAAVQGGAAQQIVMLNDAAAQAKTSKVLTKQALVAADNYRSGPGSTQSANAITELNRIFGWDLNPKATTASDAQQVHTKLAQQLAASINRSSMGLSATDVQTLISQAASADNNISSEAIHELGALSLGSFDRTQALSDAWHKAQSYYESKGKALKPSDFLDLQAQFNSIHDPRYFQEQYMTSQQKTQMLKSMSTAEKNRYEAGKSVHNLQLNKYGQ